MSQGKDKINDGAAVEQKEEGRKEAVRREIKPIGLGTCFSLRWKVWMIRKLGE